MVERIGADQRGAGCARLLELVDQIEHVNVDDWSDEVLVPSFGPAVAFGLSPRLAGNLLVEHPLPAGLLHELKTAVARCR